MIGISPSGVAEVEIQGKGPLNILDSEATIRLTEAVRQAVTAPGLRVLILRGAGTRAFVGGADIREMSKLDSASARAFMAGLRDLNETVRNCPVPVIASIRGWCLGAGMEVASVCDLRIASIDARFGMPEVTVGIPSVLHASILPRLIGASRAQWLLLTGSTIDAEHAESWGLVHRTTPPDGLDEAVGETVDQVLRCGPRSVRLQKHLIRHWEATGADLALDYSTDVFARAFDTNEPREYMERFDRRPR